MMEIDTKIEAARAGTGAALITVWGITLNEWAAIAAIVYTGLQIVLLTPRCYKMFKEWLGK